MQGTFAGIIRGSGRQKIGAILNFAFYYLIGLPVGISLALLTDLGATGMWTGLCVAVFLTVSWLMHTYPASTVFVLECKLEINNTVLLKFSMKIILLLELR